VEPIHEKTKEDPNGARNNRFNCHLDTTIEQVAVCGHVHDRHHSVFPLYAISRVYFEYMFVQEG